MAAAPRPALHRGLGRGRCQLAGAGASEVGYWRAAFPLWRLRLFCLGSFSSRGAPGAQPGVQGSAHGGGVPHASHSGLSQGTQRPSGLPVPPGAYRLIASERFFYSAENGSKGNVVCCARHRVAHCGHVPPSAALPGEGARRNRVRVRCCVCAHRSEHV